jgi:hypothetical protein
MVSVRRVQRRRRHARVQRPWRQRDGHSSPKDLLANHDIWT